MLTITLLISKKTWKQFKCPSAGKWINNLGYIPNVENYTTVEKSKLDV